MQFVLEKEKLEADRKRIEAQWCRFPENCFTGNKQRASSVEGYRSNREACRIAKCKIVIVGGKDGLPLILNSEK